jgi:hypothetical protein
MRNKLISALIIVAIPTAAYATPMPRAADTAGVGSTNWNDCTVSEMGLARARAVWQVSWHYCFSG